MSRTPTARITGSLTLAAAALLWSAPSAAADTTSSAECVISVTVKADAADAVPQSATTAVAPMRKEVTVAQGTCSGQSSAITAALAETMLAASASRADAATLGLAPALGGPAPLTTGHSTLPTAVLLHDGLLDPDLP
ncbi:hypothetical protein [Streptomyces sp. NPDC060194]|uniref:hypothetical protein n=1 Tax=Streptomyces sp. NPDC060194 TaxID=3347069 RepID=UPI003649D954